MTYENNPAHGLTDEQHQALQLGRETLAALRAVTAQSQVPEDDPVRLMLEDAGIDTGDTWNVLHFDISEEGRPVRLLMQDLGSAEGLTIADIDLTDTTAISVAGRWDKVESPLELLGVAMAGVGMVSKSYQIPETGQQARDVYTLMHIVSDAEIDGGIVIRERLERHGDAAGLRELPGYDIQPGYRVISHRDRLEPQLARSLTNLILNAEVNGQIHKETGSFKYYKQP